MEAGPRLRRLRRLPLGGQPRRDGEPRADVGQARTPCASSGIFVAAGLAPRAPGGPRRRRGRCRLPLGQPLLGHPGARAVPRPRPDRARLRRAAVGPRPAHARRADPGRERVRRAVLPARAARLPQARRHDVHHGLPGRRGRGDGRTSSATSPRCAAPSARSTSTPTATSTTGCARCPTTSSDAVDVRRFGPGERIVFEPYTREMFERTHRWMEAWELFDPGAVARPAYEDAVIA